MTRRLLIIGGTGFVGSALIPALLADGHEVALLNRGSRLVAGTRQICVDRNDAERMQQQAEEFDAVIDTCAYTGQQSEIAYRVFGPGAGMWIHLGSAAVYRSEPGHLPNEDDKIGGAEVWGDYGREKSDADRFLLDQATIPTVILRPPYLYGPGNDIDRETFVWARVLSGRPIIVPGDGSARLQFLHVSDLADVIGRFLSHGGTLTGVYNVAAPELASAEGWVRMLAELAGQDAILISGRRYGGRFAARDYFPFRDHDCAVDTRKVRAALAWEPQFTQRDGFAQTLASYDRQSLARMSPTSEAEAQIVARAVLR